MGASSRWRLFMWDFSFKGADTERTIVLRLSGRTGFGRRGDGRRIGRLVFVHVLQKCRGRHEEQVSGDGAAEVEQPVVVAGRPPDEHVLEHSLGGAWRTAVADEIRSKFALRGPAEGHVVAQ